MSDGIVFEVGVCQYLGLDVVVGGEVAQVDECGPLHVGPAAPPEGQDTPLGHDFAAREEREAY